MKDTYRQGDVLLLKLDHAPENLKPRTQNGLVILAHGEATGHHHSIPRDNAQDFTSPNGDTVITTTGATLVHQEHTRIALPDGSYELRRQREYSPQAIRNVAD